MGESKRQNIRFVRLSDYSPHESDILLTVCGDLICSPEKKDMVSRIGILGTKHFSKRPRECPCCQSESIAGIEVLGAHRGSLIWQCMKCDERYLKFNKTITNKLLRIVKDSYTVPEDWGYLPKEEFN
jgi:ribosomal protein L37AE/L43A